MKRSLFAELRRRNVFKAGAAYLALGWVVVQITATLVPALNLPSSLIPIVTWIGVIGFPFVIMFSWIYELTPEGLKRESEVDRSASITHITNRKLDYLILSLLALAIGLFAFDRFVPRRVEAPAALHEAQAPAVSSAAASAAPAAGDNSIAVLPFDNLSDEKSNAYFAEGIQEEILTRLSKIGALRVVSRTSTQQYASKPGNLPEIARQLGVANIVEGSVQKAGDSVRVNVQLIRAASDVHLWAEIYDRKLDNLFTVQSEVAGAIASQLQATLTGDEKKALATPLTTNVQAHDAWLRGVVYFNRVFLDPQGNELAIQQLTEATRLDPGFAAAWALLSRSHGSQYSQQYDHTDARKALAKAALDHAVQLAPDTTETRTAVGYYEYWVERDFAAAIRTFNAIHAREPNNIDAISALGYIARRQGRNDEALRRFNQAVELDPRNFQLMREAAWTHAQGRDYAGAQRIVDRALNVKPDDGNLIVDKAWAYQMMGRLDEAAPLTEGLRPDGSLPLVVFAIDAQANLTRQFAPAAARLQAMLAQIAAAPAARVDPITRGNYETIVGALQLRAGEADAARKNLESARDRLEAELRSEPGNVNGLMYLSRAFSELDDRDAAMKTIDRAIELLPTSSDAVLGPPLEVRRARIQAHFGEIDAPIAALTRFLKLEYGRYVSIPALRLDPDWDPLRGDARFQVLLKSDDGADGRP